MKDPLAKTLVARAALYYQSVSRFAYKWAEGKLGGDPLFMGLLRQGLIHDNDSVLDLGCGQGLLAAWLLAASTQHAANAWGDLPAPPRNLQLRGIELLPSDVTTAARALGTQADIRCGNICNEDFGSADVVVIMDVLHYIDYAAQEDVLRRVHAALNHGGRLLLRVGDADAGWGFRWSNWVDQAVVLARYHTLCRLWCRPLTAWISLLESQGFSVKRLPMSEGTGFANVLLVAQLRT